MSKLFSAAIEKSEHYLPPRVEIIDGKAVKFRDVCVHELFVADCEDPVMYASQGLWDWEKSEVGQWIMNNATTVPYWTQTMDFASYGYKFSIVARLSEPNEIYWRLKWK